MKKKIFFITITMFVIMLIGFERVVAANELTSFKNKLENSPYVETIEKAEGFKSLNIYSSLNEQNQEVLYIDLEINEDTYKTEYIYDNQIIIYAKVGSKYYDDYYNTTLLDYFAETYDYNKEKFYTYIYENKNLTLENDGIEYTFEELYTEEEMQEMQKEWEEYWETLTEEEKKQMQGIGFVNTLIFTKLKLDFNSGLKNYDESLIPYYYFFEEEKKEYVGGTTTELKFEIDAEFSLFDKVYINNKEVDSSNYIATEGSTIITLKKDYLDKLKNGNYDLKVTFKDGEFASTSFKVDNSKLNVKNPDTGIELGYGALIILLLISSVAYVLIRKQSKFPKHN